MIVTFKHLIGGYTGRADDLVIYYHRTLNRYIVRRMPHRKINQTNLDFAQVSKNLKKIMPSRAYRDDLRVYRDQYSRLKENECTPVLTWNNIYMKMMHAMVKADPSLDLKTITREQIESEELPCRSVKDAVEAGLLPAVLNYQRLDSLI